MLFQTPRLLVRRLVKSDAEAMSAIYGDIETMKYVGDSRPLPVDICLHWIEVTDGNFERRGYGMMAACEKTTGDLVACVGIVHPDQQQQPEVKYAVRRDKWGQGLATELVMAIIEYAKAELGKDVLIATVHPDHLKSQRVLTKAGFKHETDRINDDASTTQVWKWQTNEQ